MLSKKILFRRRTASCQSQQHLIVSERLGRLIACDLIGMGGSDKLTDSRPERYSYHEQRDYREPCSMTINTSKIRKVALVTARESQATMAWA